jgi:hypothetical protein
LVESARCYDRASNPAIPPLTGFAERSLTATGYRPAMISTKIFRSRWSALFWAAGIIWTAYDVASANTPDPATNNSAAAETDATGAAVDNGDLAVLANAMGN